MASTRPALVAFAVVALASACLCANTWRNGQKIGDEPPASGY